MTDFVETADRITFDDVEIDVAGRRLRVTGAEVPLEPKAFAVLLLLVRRAGRVVTRDDILDAVWGHRHVTPNVLNRIVTLLRQALGETAQDSQYLNTLHGVGYRFDAQLKFSSQREHSEEAQPSSRSPTTRNSEMIFPRTETKASSVQPLHGSADAISATFVATESTNPSTAAIDRAGDSKSAISTTGRGFRIALATVVALLLVLAFAALWWRGKASPPLASATPSLVVLPLRPIGADHGEAVLAEGLSEELITRLSHIDGLRLISSTSALLAQSGKFDPQQLADKLNVTHALDGSLRESGDQVRIDLRLVEVPGGKTLWAQNYDRALTNRFELESEIAQAVASALTLRLGFASGGSAESNVDANPALLRSVLEARTVLRNHASSADNKAEAMVRAIIAAHPDYGPAHGLLAFILTTGVLTAADSRGDEAQREAELAIRLDPALPDAYVALSRCAGQSADWERAIKMHEKALQLAPTDSVYRTTYGMLLAGLGYLEQGMHQAEIGAASDPLNYVTTLMRVRMLDTVGRHDDAKNSIDAFGPSFATASNSAYARWFNAAWRHDRADMESAIKTMTSDKEWVDSYIAVTAAIDDPRRWAEAEAAITASEEVARAEHFGNPHNFLRMLLPHPDYALALTGYDASLRSTYPTYYLMIWMPEYRAARQSSAFQDFLKRNQILDYWRAHGFPPQCHPAGDSAQCD